MTPTRIKLNNKLIDEPEFHHIIRSLLHRLSALYYFHCGEELDIDYKGLIEKSVSVRKVCSDLKWRDIERYSTRQNTKLKMGGFTGKVAYEGELKDFIPFLLLGEQLHIGKSTTFNTKRNS